jgi:anti-sigma factor RsiW
MNPDTTCRLGVARLMDYMEGTLRAPARRRLEAHVAGCGRCRGFVRSYAATPGIVRGATEARLPARAARALGRRLAAARRRA